jgi:hypothetical protein
LIALMQCSATQKAKGADVIARALNRQSQR